MAGLIEGKVAVVTGAASGLGRSICLRFAEEGAAVIVIADILEIPREGGVSTAQLVQELGARGIFVRTDVTCVDQLALAVGAAASFGGVDVMVNNAGIIDKKEFLDVTEAEYERLMAINVKGTYFGAQLAAKAMLGAGKAGSIINVSSVGGIQGSGMVSAYCASKGAVRLLTCALADALGPRGIRVNAICPGLMDTEMLKNDMDGGGQYRFPMGRRGSPNEVANAAVFLASDLASYVNGASIVVDGGLTAVL